MHDLQFIDETDLEGLLDNLEKPRKKRAWKTESLPRIITVRTTEENYAEISRLAAAREESLSGFLIIAALQSNAAEQQESGVGAKEKLAALKELLFTQAKIAVVLNEIAQAVGLANFTSSNSFDFARLEKVIAEFSAEMKIVVKKTEKLL